MTIDQEVAALRAIQQDRIQTLQQAKRLHNPFAIHCLAKTEFPASELGRREAKASRAFFVVASCR